MSLLAVRRRINSATIAASVLALIASSPLAAQRSSFTIEDVLGAPFPSSLIASPAGGRLAWIFNERG
ncbi:MAG TPA: hypothetical protein VII52_15675, partial [Gemmatimonadaceae bacterium]